MTKDLKEKCDDTRNYKGRVLCKAKWTCPYKSKTVVHTGEEQGVHGDTHFGISLPRCEVKGKLDPETKLEFLIKSANKDLDDGNYSSAGTKYKLASKLAKPLTAEQVANLLTFAYKSIEDGRIKDFVIQIGMSGGNPKKFLRDIKDISKETAIKTNTNGTWIKRYEIACEWLDKYFRKEK